MQATLASKMRPTSIKEVLGQQHLIGENKIEYGSKKRYGDSNAGMEQDQLSGVIRRCSQAATGGGFQRMAVVGIHDAPPFIGVVVLL